MADVVRIRGGRVEHRHMRHEDNDPPARCKHDLQCAVYYLWVFWRYISDTRIESGASSAQHLAVAPNAKADSGRRSCSLLWGNIDRLAEAFYGAAKLPQRRHRLSQGRYRRCDVLQRHWKVSPS